MPVSARIMLKQKRQSVMAIRRKLIAL